MNKVTLVLLKSFFVNLFLVIVKFIIGIVGHSSALVADAFHSVSDLSTDVVAIVGAKLSNKPADKEHPYGHGKLEYVTSIIMGMLIFLLGITLIINNNVSEHPSTIVIYASLLAILFKICISIYLCVCGKKLDNQILISSGKESSMDVLSSIVVLISSVLMQFSDSIFVFRYADRVSTIIIGLFIIKTAISVLRLNINLILGKAIDDEAYLEKISKIIKNIDGIVVIDSIDVIRFGSYNEARVYISVEENMPLVEAHDIAHRLEDVLKSNEDLRIKYVIVHINPIKIEVH